jgi:hypothetical protein
VLGAAWAGRDDDYTVRGDRRRPGRRLAERLAETKRVWSGDERGPPTAMPGVLDAGWTFQPAGVRRMIGSSRSVFCWYFANRGAAH